MKVIDYAKKFRTCFANGVANSLEDNFTLGLSVVVGVASGVMTGSVKKGLCAAAVQYIGTSVVSGLVDGLFLYEEPDWEAIKEEIDRQFGVIEEEA